MVTILYEAGTVAIFSGSTRVTGQNTAWLKDDIKQNDLILLSGKLYEISNVTSNTELLLTKAYTGESIDAAEYQIIQIAPQILSADMAKQVQELIDKYNAREAEMSKAIDKCIKSVEAWKKLRLFVDSDGDVAQYDVSPTPSVIIDGEPATLTTSEDIQELAEELNIGQ